MLGSKKLKETQEELSVLTKDISKLKAEFEELQKTIRNQNSLLQKQEDLIRSNHEDYRKIIDSIHRQDKILSQELQELKTIKIEIQNNITENAKLQISKSLSRIEESLAIDTTKIDDLTDEFDNLKKHISEAKSSIARLNESARSIKDTDKAFKDYAKKLEDNDKEKLRLMKRIDELETIIARMKRGGNSYHRR